MTKPVKYESVLNITGVILPGRINLNGEAIPRYTNPQEFSRIPNEWDLHGYKLVRRNDLPRPGDWLEIYKEKEGGGELVATVTFKDHAVEKKMPQDKIPVAYYVNSSFKEVLFEDDGNSVMSLSAGRKTDESQHIIVKKVHKGTLVINNFSCEHDKLSFYGFGDEVANITEKEFLKVEGSRCVVIEFEGGQKIIVNGAKAEDLRKKLSVYGSRFDKFIDSHKWLEPKRYEFSTAIEFHKWIRDCNAPDFNIDLRGLIVAALLEYAVKEAGVRFEGDAGDAKSFVSGMAIRYVAEYINRRLPSSQKAFSSLRRAPAYVVNSLGQVPVAVQAIAATARSAASFPRVAASAVFAALWKSVAAYTTSQDSSGRTVHKFPSNISGTATITASTGAAGDARIFIADEPFEGNALPRANSTGIIANQWTLNGFDLKRNGTSLVITKAGDPISSPDKIVVQNFNFNSDSEQLGISLNANVQPALHGYGSVTLNNVVNTVVYPLADRRGRVVMFEQTSDASNIKFYAVIRDGRLFEESRIELASIPNVAGNTISTSAQSSISPDGTIAVGFAVTQPKYAGGVQINGGTSEMKVATISPSGDVLIGKLANSLFGPTTGSTLTPSNVLVNNNATSPDQFLGSYVSTRVVSGSQTTSYVKFNASSIATTSPTSASGFTARTSTSATLPTGYVVSNQAGKTFVIQSPKFAPNAQNATADILVDGANNYIIGAGNYSLTVAYPAVGEAEIIIPNAPQSKLLVNLEFGGAKLNFRQLGLNSTNILQYLREAQESQLLPQDLLARGAIPVNPNFPGLVQNVANMSQSLSNPRFAVFQLPNGQIVVINGVTGYDIMKNITNYISDALPTLTVPSSGIPPQIAPSSQGPLASSVAADMTSQVFVNVSSPSFSSSAVFDGSPSSSGPLSSQNLNPDFSGPSSSQNAGFSSAYFNLASSGNFSSSDGAGFPQALASASQVPASFSSSVLATSAPNAPIASSVLPSQASPSLYPYPLTLSTAQYEPPLASAWSGAEASSSYFKAESLPLPSPSVPLLLQTTYASIFAFVTSSMANLNLSNSSPEGISQIASSAIEIANSSLASATIGATDLLQLQTSASASAYPYPTSIPVPPFQSAGDGSSVDPGLIAGVTIAGLITMTALIIACVKKYNKKRVGPADGVGLEEQRGGGAVGGAVDDSVMSGLLESWATVRQEGPQLRTNLPPLAGEAKRGPRGGTRIPVPKSMPGFGEERPSSRGSVASVSAVNWLESSEETPNSSTTGHAASSVAARSPSNETSV